MKVKEPEEYSAKAKKKKKSLETRDPKQGNIKEILKGSPKAPSEANTPTKKTHTSDGFESFSGSGYVLQPSSGGDTMDLTGECSLREKMLAAAEERLKRGQERGVMSRTLPKKPPTRGRGKEGRERGRGGGGEGGGNGDLRHLWKRGTDAHKDTPPHKKSRQPSPDDDCQVIDFMRVSSGTKCDPTKGRHDVTEGVGTVVDLEESSSEVIDLDCDISQPTSSQASTGSSVEHRTCPICCRTDIPKTVLGIHIGFCLEEMELSEEDGDV